MSDSIHIRRRGFKPVKSGQSFPLGNNKLVVGRSYKNGFEGHVTNYDSSVTTYIFRDTWYRHELLPNTQVAEGFALGSFSPLNQKP